ncbi:MAG TPA: hypothetical protein VNU71_03625 [Burkholderiaceae bacterium]|nr:hypothetical protein [Burkholderiaceae bacterium]
MKRIFDALKSTRISSRHGHRTARDSPQCRPTASQSRLRGDTDPTRVTRMCIVSVVASASPGAHATGRRRSLSRSHLEPDAEPLKKRRNSARWVAPHRYKFAVLSRPTRKPAVELNPKRPPGRADRKAAAYAMEIVRLRSAGYTFEAIREAMADVGIELSTSALRREVRRLRARSNAGGSVSPLARGPAAANRATVPPPGPSPPTPSRAAPPVSHGHDIAEAFFTANPSNQLVNHKEFP